jgi:molybdopterin converting factor small subunit
MRIETRFLGIFRDLAGGGVGEYDLPDGADVAALVAAIEARHADMAAVRGQYRVMVNGAQSTAQQVLTEGDDVAVLGPISGGCATA